MAKETEYKIDVKLVATLYITASSREEAESRLYAQLGDGGVDLARHDIELPEAGVVMSPAVTFDGTVSELETVD